MQTRVEFARSDSRRRRAGPGSIVRVVGILGRLFVAAGVLMLFYTAYLLWGTGVYTAQEQQRLAQQLAQQAPTITEGNKGEAPSARPKVTPAHGDPVFTVDIPKLGLKQVVVHGVQPEDLKKGPGHFPDCKDGRGVDCVPDTAYPGEKKNVSISGHRTTYGAPFFRLNELQKGDDVYIELGHIRYEYKVRDQKIVDPVSGYENVKQHGRDELTLTTCHPRFSAAQRMVVASDFVGFSVIGPPPPPAAEGQPAEEKKLVPTKAVVPVDVLVMASVALAALLLAMALQQALRRWALYAAIGLGSAAGLWVAVFPQILRLMPANY